MTMNELCNKFKEFFPHIAITAVEPMGGNAVLLVYSFMKPDNILRPAYRAVFSYNNDADWGFMTVSEAK